MTDEQVRRYTISIDIEVRPQDDFEHYQPHTVTGSAPDLGVEWVSANDREALCDFFAFFVKQQNSIGRARIINRALHGNKEAPAQ